ncbi:hypothetical protein BN11_2330023 [Nostocoides australiense Ben110]|uniref:Uncharacterized protein n=1 Tax=Nostocoides australiense Ben110 TaxID=1193182 RepID=W6JWH9_9MICO|nr:hypothetical protein BN11_2330023 [Tetrasphaera australiensis Ben110]
MSGSAIDDSNATTPSRPCLTSLSLIGGLPLRLIRFVQAITLRQGAKDSDTSAVGGRA